MDLSLLEQIAKGDRRSVAACIDRYGGLVWSLALRFCPDRADAEDAVQEIFIDLWSNASRYDRAIAAESTFVTMIARRRLIDRLRRRGREPQLRTLDEVSPPVVPSSAGSVELRDEAARAAKALERLKPEQRRIIERSVYLGQSHSRIAEELDLPLGTVKTHLRRGLIAVRKMLVGGAARADGVIS